MDSYAWTGRAQATGDAFGIGFGTGREPTYSPPGFGPDVEEANECAVVMDERTNSGGHRRAALY